MKSSSVLKLIGSIILCELAGIIGSLFTVTAINSWYKTILKPALNPPSWIFGPVWTTLYALMGAALFLIWRKGFEKKEHRRALILFGFQLFLNAIWSIIFFGLHSPFWALVDILALWFSILATLILFFKISRAATYLLIPYLAWVSFATYLNFMIWMLN